MCASVLLADCAADDKGEHCQLSSAKQCEFYKIMRLPGTRSASVVHDFIVDIPHE